MLRLRQEYLAEVPDRLAELRSSIDAWSENRDTDPPLATLFHRLSGSAGAYGFERVSTACRLTERWLAGKPPRDANSTSRLREVTRDLEAWFAEGPTAPDIGAE